MIKGKLRSYFIAGLIVWLPILVTFLVLRFIVGVMDSTLSLLPDSYQPKMLFGLNIPGLGVILSIFVLLFTGLLVTNYLGGKLVEFGEAMLVRIPLVSPVYKVAKQVMQTLFNSGSDAFRQAVLVQYPRIGVWSIGFLTSGTANVMQNRVQDDFMSVFIPTTPNPTSGFLIMVPKREVVLLDMPVDEAVKLVISLGVMQ